MEKVFLAMSGGVDSAVAAALLMDQGYDVHPVFLKIWSDHDELNEHGVKGECPWVQDRRDALFVSAQLGLKLQTLDFEKEYKDEVFSYFVREYKAGRTPNPDILCNEVIKFGKFLDWALENGGDYIATGHHVRREPGPGNSQETVYQLLKGVDQDKDQSYFLSRLNQYQLRHSLFPIGNFTKQEVRTKAKELGLERVAEKRSTRGICFIGKVDLKKFLAKNMVDQPGEVLNESGEVIGNHQGVSFYTIGQRKGFDVTSKKADSGPWFVIEKNITENQLVVSDNSELLNEKVLYCKELHWLDGKIKELSLSCQAKIRYGQDSMPCEISFSNKNPGLLEVRFTEAQRAIAPGQFVVFYEQEVLLGSAIIQ